MKLLKFLYKLLVFISFIIAIVFTLNLYGIEILNPYRFANYDYQKVYPNIKYYEEVLPVKDGILIVYRGKIIRIINDRIYESKIPYQDHESISDGNYVLAIAKQKNYMHYISSSKQVDISYPLKIKKAVIKDGRILVVLSGQKENHIILYDKNQNIVSSIKPQEIVVDADFSGSRVVCILKSRENNEIAIAFVDNRGIYKSKIIDQNIERCYFINDYIFLYHNKVLDLYDINLKKQKTYKLQKPPEYVQGSNDVLFSNNTIISYNKYTKGFSEKEISPFDKIVAQGDKIVTSKGNEIDIYSININRIKTIKVNSFGFQKAIINTDRLYYIFSDRIEVYKERW